MWDSSSESVMTVSSAKLPFFTTSPFLARSDAFSMKFSITLLKLINIVHEIFDNLQQRHEIFLTYCLFRFSAIPRKRSKSHDSYVASHFDKIEIISSLQFEIDWPIDEFASILTLNTTHPMERNRIRYNSFKKVERLLMRTRTNRNRNYQVS